MSEEKTEAKTARTARSLDDEIERTTRKLKKLQEEKKEKERKERERNQKAVMELIKAERLDTVPAEQWKAALPKLKALLHVQPAQEEEPAKPVAAGKTEKPAAQAAEAAVSTNP